MSFLVPLVLRVSESLLRYSEDPEQTRFVGSKKKDTN